MNYTTEELKKQRPVTIETMVNSLKYKERKFLHELLTKVAVNSKTDAPNRFFDMYKEGIVKDIGNVRPMPKVTTQARSTKRVKKDVLVAPPPPSNQTKVTTEPIFNGSTNNNNGQPIVPITNPREIRSFPFNPSFRPNQ